MMRTMGRWLLRIVIAYALDLRGRGESGGRSGDVDHIGQYEEDLTDVVAALRSAHPDRGFVLSGHSMGGGIAQRFAQASDSPAVDGSPVMGQGANFLVVIGSEDEAFNAEAYPPIVASHATVPAAVEVVEGVNHNAIIHDHDAVQRVAEWIAELGYARPEG